MATAGLVAGLQQLAETLLTQYAVDTVRPEGAKADKLSVSVKRPGISVRAPVRIQTSDRSLIANP